MIGLAHDQMPDSGVDYDQKYLYNNEAIRRSAAIIVTQEELVARIEAEARERRKETEGRPIVTEPEHGNTKLSQTFDSVIVDESSGEDEGEEDEEEKQKRSTPAVQPLRITTSPSSFS